jgi:hypothetical protein
MNKILVSNKIHEDLFRHVVDCINTALHDDLQRYLSEFRPDTTNGIPHQIGDWINTNIKNRLVSVSIRVIEFNRCGWKGKIIIDDDNKITYTIMRTKRISQIQREKREKPHYLQSIVSVFNDEFKADMKQLTFDGMEFVRFEQDILKKDCDNIFCGSINGTDSFIHCVIAYETQQNEISDIKVLLLDKDLVTVEEISLNEYIKPDYARLTNTDTTDVGLGGTFIEEDNAGLLAFKSKSQSIIKLKEVKKKA